MVDFVSSDLNRAPTLADLHQMAHHKYQAKRIARRKNLFLIYTLLTLLFVATQIALLICNSKDQGFIEDNFFYLFHQSGFASVAAFALLEACLLIKTGNVTGTLYFCLLVFNTGLALATALVFQIHPEAFQVHAHYMEFSVQLSITGVNFLLIFANRDCACPKNAVSTEQHDEGLVAGSLQVHPETPHNPTDERKPESNTAATESEFRNIEDEITAILLRYRSIEIVAAVLLVLAAISQFFIYSQLIKTPYNHKRLTHFIEFANEAGNGFMALIFATMTYFSYSRALIRHEEQVSGRYIEVCCKKAS